MKITFFHHNDNGHGMHTKPQEGFFSRLGRDPSTDWSLICSVAFVAAVILALAGARKYTELDSGQPAGPAATSSASSQIDVHALQNVLDAREADDGLRSQLIKGYAGPGDPSI